MTTNQALSLKVFKPREDNVKKILHGVEQVLVLLVALVLADEDVQLVDQLRLHLEKDKKNLMRIITNILLHEI